MSRPIDRLGYTDFNRWSVSRPIILSLDAAERAFLLCRLANVGGTAEAILHHPQAGQHVSPWTRAQIVSRVMGTVEALKHYNGPMTVFGEISKAVLVEAIEGNRYFVQMADHDPRLSAGQIARADALRVKLSRALGVTIRPVPLGEGRKRNVAAPLSHAVRKSGR